MSELVPSLQEAWEEAPRRGSCEPGLQGPGVLPAVGSWSWLQAEPRCGLANAIPSHAHSRALRQGPSLSSLSRRVCLLPLARYVISGVCQCGTRLNCLGLLAIYPCITKLPPMWELKTTHTCYPVPHPSPPPSQVSGHNLAGGLPKLCDQGDRAVVISRLAWGWIHF